MQDAIEIIITVASYVVDAGGAGILILSLSFALIYIYRCMSRAERRLADTQVELELMRRQLTEQLRTSTVDIARLEVKHERAVNKMQRKIDTLNMFIMSNGINDGDNAQKLFQFITLINNGDTPGGSG